MSYTHKVAVAGGDGIEYTVSLAQYRQTIKIVRELIVKCDGVVFTAVGDYEVGLVTQRGVKFNGRYTGRYNYMLAVNDKHTTTLAHFSKSKVYPGEYNITLYGRSANGPRPSGLSNIVYRLAHSINCDDPECTVGK